MIGPGLKGVWVKAPTGKRTMTGGGGVWNGAGSGGLATGAVMGGRGMGVLVVVWGGRMGRGGKKP